MRLCLFFFFCLARAGPAGAAEEIFATAGQTASLQKRETSARAAALGGNGVSLESGADSVLSNPAALARLSSLELGVHHQSWLAAINQENLTAAGPAYGGGAWGASLGLVDYGQIEAMDEFGQPLGGIGAQDYSLSLAWARATGAGLSVGGSVRLSREVLADEGQTQASIDLGLHLTRGRWRAGFLFADLSSTLMGGGRGPSAVRGELSLDLRQEPGGLRACAGFSAEPDGLSRFQAGLESVLYQGLSARAGYEARLGNTLVQGFSGATFGLGFSLGSTVLDYAFLPFGDLGAGHRVSLKWRMSRTVPVAPVVAKALPLLPLPLPPPLPAPEATLVATPVPVPTAEPQRAEESLQFKVTEDALELARRAEEHGHFEEARALHQGLLDRYPRNMVVWRSLGDLYYRAQRKAEAVAAYDRALEEGLINSELEQWLEKYRSQP